MGSPYTHKWCWDFYTPQKQILEVFPFTDEGWLEALEIEKRILSPIINDIQCLNENVGGNMSLSVFRHIGKNHFKNGTGCFSLSKEERSRLSKEITKRQRKNKTGLFGMSLEEKCKNAKKGGLKAFELKKGIFALTEEERKKLNQKHKEEKIGIYGMSEERKSEISRKNGKIVGKKCFENKTGLFGLSEEDKMRARKNGGKVTAKKLNSEKWICLETGFITTSGPLTRYQNKRGIDTSKRERVK
jgi:hypothetical protein